MTPEQIKEYLSMLLDMETNMLIQKRTLVNLMGQRDSLGHKRNFRKPEPKYAYSDTSGYMVKTGIAIGAICAIITAIVVISGEDSNSGVVDSFFNAIKAVGLPLLVGLGSGVVGGLILGGIIGACVKGSRQSELNREYNEQLTEYGKEIVKDELRVKDELVQREFIIAQIEELKKQRRKSKETLDKMYSCNIIDEDYRYDIVAISSFYQYFRKQKTYSLVFDPKTGDRGAYNIFDEEVRLGLIISKLDTVIDKLDEISSKQSELLNALHEANRKVDALSSNVKSMSSTLRSSIEANTNAVNTQTALNAYNAERINTELRYMNTMNTIYNWH